MEDGTIALNKIKVLSYGLDGINYSNTIVKLDCIEVVVVRILLSLEINEKSYNFSFNCFDWKSFNNSCLDLMGNHNILCIPFWNYFLLNKDINGLFFEVTTSTEPLRTSPHFKDGT